MRTGCAKAVCCGANGKRSLKVLGLSAHAAINNLQLVFPELGRALDYPEERSEQKAEVAPSDRVDAGPGERQTAPVAPSDRVDPGPGERQTTAVSATNQAGPVS